MFLQIGKKAEKWLDRYLPMLSSCFLPVAAGAGLELFRERGVRQGKPELEGMVSENEESCPERVNKSVRARVYVLACFPCLEGYDSWLEVKHLPVAHIV